MVSFTCPSCGATMELDELRDILYCMYCGQKLLIDQRSKKVRIEKTVNINQKYEKHTINEAEIEREKTKQKRNESISDIIALIVATPIIIAGLWFCIKFFGFFFS